MPPWVDYQSFMRGMDAIDALNREAAIRLLVTPLQGPGVFQLEVVPSHRQAADILESFRLDPQRLEVVVEDIVGVLWSLAVDVPREEFVERRSTTTGNALTEDAELAGQKYDRVLNSSFDIEAVRRRLWAKQSTTALLLTRFGWEAVTKHLDEERPSPEGMPVALGLVRIVGDSNDTYNDVDLTLALDSEDVGHLIDSLTRLRTALTKLGGSDGR